MDSKIVPDTSAIIDGRITEALKQEKGVVEIIIPEAAVCELENQANMGRETGLEGLNELKELRKIANEAGGRITIRFHGKPPTDSGIKMARAGAIDEIIRKVAEENDATLVTSDKIQALVSEAKGLKVLYIGPKVKTVEPRLFNLFDAETASVHMKENTPVYAKKGHVGRFVLTEIMPNITREDLDLYAKEIVACARSDPKGYMEMEKRGASVIQLREYRIVIARPPFSDGLEITAVRPIVKTRLEDYKLSKKLLDRLASRAEGIFIAGAPGQGKSTFAQAIAEFYLSMGKIIKTMESPRDLQVPDVVTQYTGLEGSMEATADVLLLVRPDYTIYDEVRKTKDFQIFADMRLAGVGLVGVCHASKAIDAVQRLIGRVELGIIPHVVDTILFIEAGQIRQVYELRMTVKVPFGMRDGDLSRPVIEIRDFETGNPQYEMYSFGEEVVVIPVRQKAAQKEEQAKDEISIANTKKAIVIRSGRRDEMVTVCADGEDLFNIRTFKNGMIKIKRSSQEGRMIQNAIASGQEITLS